MDVSTIKINSENVKIGEAVEMWKEAGICQNCIDRRLYLNRTYQDSYGDFAFAHDERCLC